MANKRGELGIAINVQFVPVDKVRMNDYNPKDSLEESKENRELYEKLVKTILDHGFTEPVECRETEDGSFEIVDGQHRYLALRELGATEVPINNLGKLSRDEAMTRTLNKDLIKIPINDLKLAKVLLEISEAGRKRLPFTDKEVQERLDMLAFDWDKFVQNDVSFEEGKATPENTIKAGVDEETFKKIRELLDQGQEGECEIQVRRVYRVRLTSAIYRRLTGFFDRLRMEGTKGDKLGIFVLERCEDEELGDIGDSSLG